MLERGSLNDVKIKLSDGEIVTNKDILMVRSDYFATMFNNNNFIEGETSSVDMSHCSKAVMEKIVKFLFSGAVTFEDLSLAQLLELTHVSEMMLLHMLMYNVEDYITFHRVKLSELILGLKIADTYNLTSLASYITRRVFLNLKDIPNDVESSDSFKTLPFHKMREIIQLYNVDKLYVPTFAVFEAFMIWLSENEVTNEERNEILDSLNFEDFTVEELMNSVRVSGLYSGLKIDKRVLEIVKEKDLKIQEQELKIKQLESQS